MKRVVPADLSDTDLLDELAVCEDPDETLALRALAAQRGLWNAAHKMPAGERRTVAEEQGTVT